MRRSVDSAPRLHWSRNLRAVKMAGRAIPTLTAWYCPWRNGQWRPVKEHGEPLETTGRNLAFQLGLGYTLFEKK